jgi:hypothetical protein
LEVEKALANLTRVAGVIKKANLATTGTFAQSSKGISIYYMYRKNVIYMYILVIKKKYLCKYT